MSRIVILLASCLGFRLNHSYIKSVGFRGLSVPTPLRSATRPARRGNEGRTRRVAT